MQRRAGFLKAAASEENKRPVHTITAGEMITSPVVTVELETIITKLLAEKHIRIGAVLVTSDNGRLTGIFNGRDAVWHVVAEGRGPASTELSDAMTRSPDAIGPRDALQMMFFGGYRHLPIVDDNGKIIGIVSRGDFTRRELALRDDETGFWEIMNDEYGIEARRPCGA